MIDLDGFELVLVYSGVSRKPLDQSKGVGRMEDRLIGLNHGIAGHQPDDDRSVQHRFEMCDRSDNSVGLSLDEMNLMWTMPSS